MSKHPLYNHSGLQRENKSHVLYALANKQMELKCLQEEYQAKIHKLSSDIAALHVTMCLFDENCEELTQKINQHVTQKSHRGNSRYFHKGECRSLVLDVLKGNRAPLRTEEISLLVQERKGIALDNNGVNKKIQKSVVDVLRKLESAALVRFAGRQGVEIRWQLAN